MTNKNKLIVAGVVALALLLGGLGVAKASGSWDWNKVQELVADRLAAKVEAPIQASEPTLGAVAGPDLPNPHCENGECTWMVSQAWVHGTNTIFSVQDPFQSVTGTAGGVVLKTLGSENYTGASTTVDLVRVYQTGAVTSSFGVACGPATTANGAGIEDAKRIVSTTVSIPTSTLGIVENNVTAALGARIDGGTVAKTIMGPQDPYFNCKVVANDDGLAGVNNADSLGAGRLYVRFKRAKITN